MDAIFGGIGVVVALFYVSNVLQKWRVASARDRGRRAPILQAVAPPRHHDLHFGESHVFCRHISLVFFAQKVGLRTARRQR